MKHSFIRTAAAVVAAVFLCAGSAGAAEFQGRISAKSAILIDADSGRVLFENKPFLVGISGIEPLTS